MPPLRPDTVTRFRPLAELVPDHWTASTTAAADGTALHWTDTGGVGPPVVLIHGLQVDGLNWLRTARALEGAHRVIMPDLRGHGRSGRVHAPVSIHTYADDVVAVLAAAGVEAGIVIGHSLGADVAGVLAVRQPTRALVLVDPAPSQMPAAAVFDDDDPPPWMAAILDTLRTLAAQPHAERVVTGLRMLPPGAEVDWHEADYVSFVEGQARFDLGVFRHLDADVTQLSASPDRIAAIACPILLLTAQPMLPGVDVEATAAVFASNWRDGRHVHFPDSGHAIHADQFDRFIGEVTRFIDAQVARRTD